ncbi:MAG: hypothetical protein AB7K24_27250 [Gemmataceae bacterium]
MRVRNLVQIVGCVISLVAVLVVPTLRWGVWGLLNRETIVDGAPMSYWFDELESGDDTAARCRAVQAIDRIEAHGLGMKATYLGVATRDKSAEVRRLAVESLGRIGATGYPVS